MKGLDYLARMIYAVSRATNVVSCVALVLMMVLVFINVVARAFGHPIFGTYEAVGFLASILVAFSIAHRAVNKGHIAVNILEDLLPQRILPVLDSIVAILGTGLYLVLAWQCLVYANIMRTNGELSMSMEIPFWPLIIGIAFGFFMLALVLLIDLFKSLVRTFKP
jgi:TRAP-type C4-dicarboxylate transport system permease small subunit